MVMQDDMWLCEDNLAITYLVGQIIAEEFAGTENDKAAQATARRRLAKRFNIPPFKERGKTASYSEMRWWHAEYGAAASLWFNLYEEPGRHAAT
jgi:hypothetical protein